MDFDERFGRRSLFRYDHVVSETVLSLSSRIVPLSHYFDILQTGLYSAAVSLDRSAFTTSVNATMDFSPSVSEMIVEKMCGLNDPSDCVLVSVLASSTANAKHALIQSFQIIKTSVSFALVGLPFSSVSLKNL